jgi:adenylate kinase
MNDTERYRSVLLFGAPGTGKGTQGSILGKVPGFYHIAVGDIFRAIDKQSPLGQEIHSYVSAGKLVPDDLTIRIWRQAVQAHVTLGSYKPWRQLLIVDGLPRNVEQAQLAAADLEVLRVVYLKCRDEEEMIRRIQLRAIQENRADDTDVDIIRHRFDVYRQVTAPVLDFYEKELVADVEASGTPAEVLARILAAVIPAHTLCFH